MLFDVKNTTVRILSDLICPHYCSLCGKIGSVLCDCCKNDLNADYANQCLACGSSISDYCPTCTLPFSGQWTFSARNHTLAKMISAYKYDSVRAFSIAFADFLHACLPSLPSDTVVVPMPTIRQHIRERGFDHTLLIAKELCRKRRLVLKSLIGRAKNTIQVGANRSERLEQAKSAYCLTSQPNPDTPYLLLDDVWTTGASLCSACNLLKENGARHLMVAVIARSVNP